MLSEIELITELKNRTKVGAAALYDQYGAMIYKVICCHVKNEELAEQILENVIKNVWNSFDEFGEQTNHLSLWIMAMTRASSKVPTTTFCNEGGEDDTLEFTVKPI